MKQIIHRKDGITYEREVKDKNYNIHMQIKYYDTQIEKLKYIAEYKGINYSELVRNLCDDYIAKEYAKLTNK